MSRSPKSKGACGKAQSVGGGGIYLAADTDTVPVDQEVRDDQEQGARPSKWGREATANLGDTEHIRLLGLRHKNFKDDGTSEQITDADRSNSKWKTILMRITSVYAMLLPLMFLLGRNQGGQSTAPYKTARPKRTNRDIAGFDEIYFGDDHSTLHLPTLNLDNIHKDWHPEDRKDRFPGVLERVKLYMSNWYHPPCPLATSERFTFRYHPNSSSDDTFSSRVVDINQISLSNSSDPVTVASVPSQDLLFFLDQRSITETKKKQYSPFVWSYCRDFKQRDIEILFQDYRAFNDQPPVLTTIGDSPFEVSLVHAGLFSVPGLAKYRGSTARHDLEAVTTMNHGNCIAARQRLETVPEYKAQIYEQTRTKTIPASPIIWKLHTLRHFGKNLDKARHCSTSWENKVEGAVWRGGCTGSKRNSELGAVELSQEEMCDELPRCKFVTKHINSTSIDAGFVLGGPKAMGTWFNNSDLTKGGLSVEEQLRYKIIICMEGNDVSSGLKWMLLSNSVVLMPLPTRTSWAMEELLEPFVHYVPMEKDGSNAEEMVQWILKHEEKAQQIAERATLFMEDMLYHPVAERDELEIKREIMRRYRAHWTASKMPWKRQRK